MLASQLSGFSFFLPQDYMTLREAIVAANPELDGIAYFYGVTPFIGPAGRPFTVNNARSWAAGNSGTVVTTFAQRNGTVEALLDVIDYLYGPSGTELIGFGVEGVSFYFDADGNRQWTDLVLNDPVFNFGDAVFKYAIPTWGDWPRIMSYEAWLSQETRDPDAYRAHQNYLLADIALAIPAIQMTAEESEEFNRIRTDAETLVNEYFVQMVVGIRPLSDIDVLFSELERVNIRRAVEIFQGAYDRFWAR